MGRGRHSGDWGRSWAEGENSTEEVESELDLRVGGSRALPAEFCLPRAFHGCDVALAFTEERFMCSEKGTGCGAASVHLGKCVHLRLQLQLGCRTGSSAQKGLSGCFSAPLAPTRGSGVLTLFLDRAWARSPEPIYCHRVGVKESTKFTARCPAWGQAGRMRSSRSEDLNSSKARKGFLRQCAREGHGVRGRPCAVLWLAGGEAAG